MTTSINGNNVRIYIEANELTENRVNITLPDGYSYETIHITLLDNISQIASNVRIANGETYHIPPVRSRSPSTFSLLVNDPSKKAEIRIIIEKFGQIPDAQYFNRAFEPILVVGDDGNEYNVIPSDQFK